MLLNHFIRIISCTEEEGVYYVTTEIDPAHKIFEGHFPGQPVTPGVCLIQSLKEIVEQVRDVKLKLYSAVSIKFLAVINPNISREVKWEINITGNEPYLDVKCIAFWNEKVCLKFAGRLK